MKNISFNIDKNLFDIECINQVGSMFTSDYYVSLSDTDNQFIEITISSKNGNELPIDIKEIFNNDLIDHKTWLDLNNRFGYLRDKIVEQAFSSTKR